MIYQGDCLEVLTKIKDDSIDALITDPPAGIAFMGKEWDKDKGGRFEWIDWMTAIMSEALRTMKPGAHGLVWALPRTSHWTASALEDAGFEIRDVVTHLFGTGFPKSLNVAKAGAGDAWQGWGTALKPASEHWILIRKPCSEKTVAANVLKHGTGAINVDAGRIAGAFESGWSKSGSKASENVAMSGQNYAREPKPDSQVGRFPSNVILDEEAAKALDEQSGLLKNGGQNATSNKGDGIFLAGSTSKGTSNFAGDSGGASRFFYVAKASKADRGEGNTHPTVKSSALMRYLIRLITPPGGTVLDPFMGSGSTGIAAKAEGMKFVGIEREHEFFLIADKRLKEI